jgi:hypothetical protein
MAQWRDNIDKYLGQKPIDIDQLYKKTYHFSGNEPGIAHPTTGSSVRLRDDGCIDIFAGENLGIRLDPNANSVNIFGDVVNIWSSKTSIHTDANRLLWNYNPLNPDMYQHYNEDYLVSGTMKVWDKNKKEWKRVAHNVRPYLKSIENETLNWAVKELIEKFS